MNIQSGKFRTLSEAEQNAGRTLSIQRVFALMALFNGMVLVALMVSSLLLMDASKGLDRTNAIRYRSYLLVDELRQSSDDLTRFARTYVVTGEPKWEGLYWDALAIRNGTQPRPERYEAIYWDIAAVDSAFRADAPTTAVPLAKRMEQLGFTAGELGKLKESEANSNELASIEKAAMNAIKGVFMDPLGEFSVQGKPDPQLARRLMHDGAYHLAKAKIMRPLSAAYDLLDARTDRLVKAAIRLQDQFLDLTILLIILLGLSATASYQIMARRIVRPLTLLAEESEQILDDRPGQELSVYSRDEVGLLAEAFNAVLRRMRSALKEADSANRQMRAAHKQIDDSINYAGLLQRTILPERQLMQAFAADHFVLWQPRDQVGGDFYVFHSDDQGRYLIGIADCAGHGVPGAMMTMLARAGVDRAIQQVGIASPAAVLTKTDEVMRAMLADAHLSRAIATSTDAGLVYVDREAGLLRFAGAKIALYWSDGESVEEVKGERRALADRKPGRYQDHEMPLLKGRTYYLTTDGFLDQAGGEHGFGFGDSRFAAMLRDHAGHALPEQGAAFSGILAQYQGGLAQRDDITILSFRFN
ncbi:SpoIIE family protein phosphatase [Methylomagnum sp.]